MNFNIFEPLMKTLEAIVVFLLKNITAVVGNYGISIIVITILMRIVIFPLTLKQEKSMKKMKEFQPEIDKLKKKYGDDPQKLNEETMKLYKEHKINPFGGCWPMLIQMPIFIALYTAFNGKTIPNDATFLWFNLKSPDRLVQMGRFAINLLPILNVIVTYVQMKMSSSSQGDDPAAKQMQSMTMMMPFMMLFLFYNMPSGVTLYYLVSGVIGLVLQYFILKGRNEGTEEAKILK